MERIAIWKKALGKEPEGVGFLRRHGRLLPYLGALIVFLTFVVKEGLGEHWRRFAETIDSAQNRYSAQVDARNMREYLEDIRQENFKNDKANRFYHEHFENDWYRPNIRKSWDDLRGLDISLEDLSILIEKLQKPEYEARIAELKKAEEDGQRETDFLAERFNVDDPRTPPHQPNGVVIEQPEWTYVPKKQRHFTIPMVDGKETEAVDAQKPDEKTRMKVRAATLVDSVNDLREDINDFTEGILKDAEKTKRANEILSKYAWWITAFLFGVGWCIGLAGKVYGLPEGGGVNEEERSGGGR